MESAARNPYRLTRPVFDLIPGGRVDRDELESYDLTERLRTIESQNREILEILAPLSEGETGLVSKSAVKPLWYLFWVCQISGLVSLVMADLPRLLTIKGDVKFLGLALTFIGLESAFLAKFAERRVTKHAEEKA